MILRSISVFLLAVSLLFTFGCSSDRGEAVTWEVLNLEGKRLILLDPKRTESYSFDANGEVTAYFGESDDRAIAPVLKWRIEGGRLVIQDEEGEMEPRTFSAPHINGNILTVNTSALSHLKFKVK